MIKIESIFVVTEEGALHETFRDVNARFPELAKQFLEELNVGRRPIILSAGYRDNAYIAKHLVPISKSRFLDFGKKCTIVTEAEVFRFIAESK